MIQNLKLKSKCINTLKEYEGDIIIVAAVRESEAIANSCRDLGINVKAFCDSEKRKSLKKFCGLEVIHTPNLPKRLNKAKFVIASTHIDDCINQLSKLGFNDFYSGLELLKNYDLKNHKHSISESFMKSRISVYKKTHEVYFHEDKTYLRSLDVMITTKCSLKCESCSNLMQYYKNPLDSEYEQILNSLDIISKNVDEISEFRVIGGEPLMNKKWAEIVYTIAVRNPKKEIHIYTNGTIIPKDEQLEKFVGKKITFVITDYDRLSPNVPKILEKLKNFKISFVRTPAENWIECSKIKQHRRSSEQLKEVFTQCCVKYLYTLLDGKLYRCPFIANAANLKAIPDNPLNYVDILSEGRDVKAQIKRLVKHKSFFPACDFCVGRPYDATTNKGYDGEGLITPGIQTSKPLPYKLQ